MVKKTVESLKSSIKLALTRIETMLYKGFSMTDKFRDFVVKNNLQYHLVNDRDFDFTFYCMSFYGQSFFCVSVILYRNGTDYL